MKSVSTRISLLSFCLLSLTFFSNYEALTVTPHMNKVPQYKQMVPKVKKMFSKKLASRHLRNGRGDRKLDGRGIFNGTNLGIAGLGAGAYYAYKGRAYQKEQVKAMAASIKSQMNQFFVLNQKNQEFYHEMDEHLTELEEKIEDLADSSVQKISEFDMRIRSKIAGKPFMPMISY